MIVSCGELMVECVVCCDLSLSGLKQMMHGVEWMQNKSGFKIYYGVFL
jgi:hypothetical protein